MNSDHRVLEKNKKLNIFGTRPLVKNDNRVASQQRIAQCASSDLFPKPKGVKSGGILSEDAEQNGTIDRAITLTALHGLPPAR